MNGTIFVNTIAIVKSVLSKEYGILLSLTILGVILRIYNAGNFDFRVDEFQVIEAAKGYLETQTFYRWDWLENTTRNNTNCTDIIFDCYYTRAWLHTLMVTVSFYLFGVSEFSARIPTVFFGSLLIPVFYYFCLYFTKNRSVALYTTIIITIYPWLINYSRYTRMYAVFIPLFLITAYVGYRLLTNVSHFISISIVGKRIEIPFDWRYSLLFSGLLIILEHLHINGLIILPSLLVYSIVRYAVYKEKRFRWLSILGITCFISLILFDQFFRIISRYSGHISTENPVYMYIVHMFLYPLGPILGILFSMFCLMYILVYLKNYEITKRTLFLISIVVTSFIFYIFFTDRFDQTRYVSHILPITLITTILGVYYAVSFIPNNRVRILAYTFPLFFAVIVFIAATNTIYNGDRQVGVYTQAYKTLVDEYKRGEVIIGQHIQEYYLQGINSQVIVKNVLNTNTSIDKDISFLKKNLDQYEGVWVVYSTALSFNISEEFRQYVCNNFEQKHGQSCGIKIDDTYIDVFYYSRGAESVADGVD